ncbi:MAG: pantoate--beta-alanine ligase [Dongiaceae bacterium]
MRLTILQKFTSPEPLLFRTVKELRDFRSNATRAGKTIGLVPTMGALHAGHMELANQAKRICDYAIVTIFVNPTQFAANEDLSKYPRQEAADIALCARHGVDAVFAPDAAEMYPPNFGSSITVSGVTEKWEGEFRPTHFAGVATVVAKLLLQAMPDKAFFGKKDYQQLQTVKKLVRDLNIPTQIIGVPTVREADGLALSSRNVYLAPHERRVAPLLNKNLQNIAQIAHQGGDIEAAVEKAKADLSAAGFGKVDYIAVVNAETLEEWNGKGEGRVIAAVYLGKTRLIDNVAV